jgi:hypothetical protein
MAVGGKRRTKLGRRGTKERHRSSGFQLSGIAGIQRRRPYVTLRIRVQHVIGDVFPVGRDGPRNRKPDLGLDQVLWFGGSIAAHCGDSEEHASPRARTAVENVPAIRRPDSPVGAPNGRDPHDSVALPVVRENVSTGPSAALQHQPVAVGREVGKEVGARRRQQRLQASGGIQPDQRPTGSGGLAAQVDQRACVRE